MQLKQNLAKQESVKTPALKASLEKLVVVGEVELPGTLVAGRKMCGNCG
jgi:hypothetical protein